RRQLDCIISNDTGTPSSNANLSRFLVHPDSVKAVQVQVNSLDADFGSRSGGHILVTPYSGTCHFHCTMSGHRGRAALNSNTFFNNKNGIPKPQYRFHNYGGTIGGPVLLPWTDFNKARNKMFFFYSEEHQINHGSNTNSYTMPTAAELAGDFSQTNDSKGPFIKIIHPTPTPHYPNTI